MAKWIEWTPEQQQAWDEWMAERPEVIRKMAAEHNLSPDKLYLYKHDGNDAGVCCTLVSFDEDKTVTINITAELNPDHLAAQLLGEIWNRSVFGIPPEKLSECGLPRGIEVVAGASVLND